MRKVNSVIVLVPSENGPIKALMQQTAKMLGFDEYAVTELEANTDFLFRRFRITCVHKDDQPSDCESRNTASSAPDGSHST